MLRSRLASLSALAALAVSACDAPSRLASPSTSAAFSSSSNSSGSSSKESENNAGDDGESGGSVGRRIFEVRTARTQVSNQAGVGTGIYFHGGRVLQTGASVAAVYWAPTQPVYAGGPSLGVGSAAQDGSLVGHFLRNLGGSPYFSINSTYTDASGRNLANTLSYAGYWATSTNAPAPGQSVTDAQILSMLQGGFSSGALTYNANTIYAVFTAGTANLGGGFGTQYCAYHWYGNVTINGQRKSVLYAAMPYDYAYPSACSVFGGATKPANGDAAADAEVSVLAHEIVETVTDAQGTAWYDRSGNENADKCAWTYGTTFGTSFGGTANMTLGGKSFLVQRNWINAGSGGCVLSVP